MGFAVADQGRVPFPFFFSAMELIRPKAKMEAEADNANLPRDKLAGTKNDYHWSSTIEILITT